MPAIVPALPALTSPLPFAGEVGARSVPGEGAPTTAQPFPDPSQPPDPKIWQAAQAFESMAIGQLLAPMFDTVDLAHSLFGGGEAEATWRPMLVDAIGKQMEAQGGLGLAQPVYAAMLRAQETGGQPKQVPQPARRHAAYQPRSSP